MRGAVAGEREPDRLVLLGRELDARRARRGPACSTGAPVAVVDRGQDDAGAVRRRAARSRSTGGRTSRRRRRSGRARGRRSRRRAAARPRPCARRAVRRPPRPGSCSAANACWRPAAWATRSSRPWSPSTARWAPRSAPQLDGEHDREDQRDERHAARGERDDAGWIGQVVHGRARSHGGPDGDQPPRRTAPGTSACVVVGLLLARHRLDRRRDRHRRAERRLRSSGSVGRRRLAPATSVDRRASA